MTYKMLIGSFSRLRILSASVLLFSFSGFAGSLDSKIYTSEMIKDLLEIEKQCTLEFSVEDIDEMVSHVLTIISDRNVNLPLCEDDFNRKFANLRLPGISLRDYIDRFRRYANFEPSVLIITLIHIDFLIQTIPGFIINHNNVHRFFLISLLVASKYVQDSFWSNKYVAKIGGLPVAELNMLEVEFLYALNFDLVDAKGERFTKYASEIGKKIVEKKLEAKYKAQADLLLIDAFERIQIKSKLGFSEQPIFHLPNGFETGVE